jgi:hypothetical protein
VIGASSVRCGARTGRGPAARWIDDTLQEITIQQLPGTRLLDGVLGGLLRLRARLADNAQLAESPLQVRALIADTLVSMLEVPWSRELQRPDSAAGYAQAQLSEAGFSLEGPDPVRLDDGPFGQPRLAVSYPGVLLDALQQLAANVGGRLVSVLPVGLAAWSSAKAQPHFKRQVFGVMGEDAVLLGRVERSAWPARARLGDVTVRTVHSTATETLSQEWRRLQLRQPHLAPQAAPLPVLDLTPDATPGAEPEPALDLIRWPAAPEHPSVTPGLQLAAQGPGLQLPFDAIPPKAHTTALQWLTLAGLTTLIMLASLDGMQTRAQHQDVAARLSRQQHATQAPPKPKPLNRIELARLEAVDAAIRQLNQPTAALLHALQPPRDIDVAILTIETQGTAAVPVLKIEAQAPSPTDMAHYVSYVSTRWPMAEAHLTRHEVDASLPGQPYRFNVEARWRE